MAKPTKRYVCQSCGTVQPKWQGQCPDCSAWNSLTEESAPVVTAFSAKHNARSGGQRIGFAPLNSREPTPAALPIGIGELDRVLGGGLVAGSATLIGGDPGIGKSTLLLQAAARLAQSGVTVVYISGEEATEQIRLRARRLGVAQAPVALASATSVRDIITTLEAGPPPALLIIDSIQTVYLDTLEAAPGTVSQVRAASFELIRYAKSSGTALILVGHVTKDGQIAGPRVLEHMVDAVLYFEGERGHAFRILRGVKNRFGAVDEIGVFEMGEQGLTEVTNPSALFLSGRETPVSGSVVFAGVEGSRPLLVEIQALVVRLPSGATPRRAVVGWDPARMAMALAVLEARCGLSFSNCEVYLSVAGGLRLSEPALDVAAAAALTSALLDAPLPPGLVCFGEIALSGDIRPVAHAQVRLKEAAKLGLSKAWVPPDPPRTKSKAPTALDVSRVATVAELVDRVRGQR